MKNIWYAAGPRCPCSVTRKSKSFTKSEETRLQPGSSWRLELRYGAHFICCEQHRPKHTPEGKCDRHAYVEKRGGYCCGLHLTSLFCNLCHTLCGLRHETCHSTRILRSQPGRCMFRYVPKSLGEEAKRDTSTQQ